MHAELPNDVDVRECDRCHKQRVVSWTTDPYLDEIYPEDLYTPSWWCKECWFERKGDI